MDTNCSKCDWVIHCVSCCVVQVIRKGEVSCCWICTACKDNEYVLDEFTCKVCDIGWWPKDELEGTVDPSEDTCCRTGLEVFTLIGFHSNRSCS